VAASPVEPVPVATTTGTSDPAGAPDAGADAGPSVEALAGRWEGTYDAKKGRVTIAADVKDDARTADDGKKAAGAGSVELMIGPDGEVRGKSQGALGAATVRGKLDGKMLRASFVPNDPLAPQAMTGVLVGIVKGDVIQAEVRVAGPDAVLVRQSTFDLKKK